MKAILETLMHDYEQSQVVNKYRLTREEFIYLSLIAEGCEHPAMMDYLNCKKDKLYQLRNHVVEKMRAENMCHAIMLYTSTAVKCSSKNEPMRR